MALSGDPHLYLHWTSSMDFYHYISVIQRGIFNDYVSSQATVLDAACLSTTISILVSIFYFPQISSPIFDHGY